MDVVCCLLCTVSHGHCVLAVVHRVTWMLCIACRLMWMSCLCVQADPYIEVVLGKKKLNSRDEYLPNTVDPVFGR